MKRLNKNVVYPYNLFEEILICDGCNDNITNDMVNGLEFVLKTLDERGQEMIRLRYEGMHTFEEIATMLSVAKTRPRDIIFRSLRKLRHPSNIKYIRYGLEFLTQSENEENQRRERVLKAMQNNARYISIVDLEEISVRTYLSLQSKGLNTIGDIINFKTSNGVEWYRLIPNFGVKSLNEIENVLLKYTQTVL